MLYDDSMAKVQSSLREIYGSKHYYTDRYCIEELQYCGHIPEWLRIKIESLKKTDTVLDIGCAYGTLAAYTASISACIVACIDKVRLLSPLVAEKYRLGFIQGDIEREEFSLPSLSAIILTEVLEHFNFHPGPTLKKIYNLMLPGASLFISTPNADIGWGRVQKYDSLDHIPAFPGLALDKPEWFDGHVWHYNEQELQSLLVATGFRIQNWATSLSPGGQHFNVEAVKV